MDGTQVGLLLQCKIWPIFDQETIDWQSELAFEQELAEGCHIAVIGQKELDRACEGIGLGHAYGTSGIDCMVHVSAGLTRRRARACRRINVKEIESSGFHQRSLVVGQEGGRNDQSDVTLQ